MADDRSHEYRTLQWTLRSRLDDGRYCTLVIDTETLEASLHFEAEASSPIEFILDTIQYPHGRVSHPDDEDHFFPHLLNAVRGLSVTGYDFNGGAEGVRVTVTTNWSGISSWRIHPNGTHTPGPFVSWTYHYSGFYMQLA